MSNPECIGQGKAVPRPAQTLPESTDLHRAAQRSTAAKYFVALCDLKSLAVQCNTKHR